MMNIIKASYYRYSRSKWAYIYLFWIILYTGVMLYPNLGKITGFQEFYLDMDSVGIFGVLFLAFICMIVNEDFSSGSIKNILGRGIKREKYLIGNIISMSSINIGIWIIFLLITVINDSVVYGVGNTISFESAALGIILNIIYITAFITMGVVITILSKNGIIGAIGTFIIFYINTIVALVSKMFFKSSFNVHQISLSYYMDVLGQNPNDLKIISIGIVVGIAYILVFSIIGIVILNKQDVK